MLVNIGVALVISIVMLFTTALISNIFFNGGYSTPVLQTLGMVTLSFVLLKLGFVGMLGAVAIGAFPIITRGVSSIIVMWLGHRAMSGKMGKESQWAAELVNEGDDEFMQATNVLSSYDLREIAVIAESKEELRELTIERYEEHAE